MIVSNSSADNVKSRSYDNLLKDALELEETHTHPLELGSLRAGMDFEGIQSAEGQVQEYHSGFQSSLTGALFPSTTTQDTNNRAYNVHVQLQTVDLRQDYLCGYLTIDELTDQYPRLTTYFDGYVIAGLTGNHSFVTRGWGADETVDVEHWRKFAPFRQAMDQGEQVSVRQMDDVFRVDQEQICKRQCRYLFMRWKEQFLVPDHRIRSVQGASYDGFYYIMYDVLMDRLEGYYYHESSERNQHLQLRPTGRERSSSFDFC